jgi:hypothetical protein
VSEGPPSALCVSEGPPSALCVSEGPPSALCVSEGYSETKRVANRTIRACHAATEHAL